MKNNLKYVICFLGITLFKVAAQNPEIKADLPTVIPPSPTVAALMKFEEVPVSNYTGVPDISIPLLNLPTQSKDINLDISLKYHSGVSANDIASDVGLGWSLFTGGTISRTVRGLPDEELILTSGQSNSGKVGVYHNNYPNHNNSYYYFIHNIFNEDEYSFYDNYSLSASVRESINEFIWSSNQLNKFDTEHDLWQFNFMGHSGRFYIKKNTSNNTLEIVPLDDYKLKIYYNYTTVGINNYIPESFTVYDEKGYKYIFNIAEKSKSFSAYEKFIYGQTDTQRGTTSEKEHISAIHLSSIFDSNNNLLISFSYTDNGEIKECRKDFVEVSNEPYGINSNYYQSYATFYPCMNEFPPYKTYTNNSELIKVRKLNTINIPNHGVISFDYGLGRQDTDISLSGQAPYLKTITLKDLSSNIIKKFEFNYEYSNVLTKRMMLKSLVRDNVEKHELFYEQNDFSGYFVGKDYWGYLNLILPCRLSTKFNKEVSPSFSTTDLLQKIKYPSGGCVIFDFEPNSYSYIGDVPLTNFDDNPENFTSYSEDFNFSNTTNNNNTNNSNNSAGIQLLDFFPSENVKVKFFSSITYPELIENATKSFKLVKLVQGVWTQVTNLTCPFNRDNCCVDFVLEAGYQYGIKREILVNPYTGTNNSISVEYFIKIAQEKKYVFGGGNRIKQIGYFDIDVSQYYFNQSQNNITPNKLKQFKYNFFDDINKSSGSLVYAKPVYEAESNFIIKTQCNIFQGSGSSEFGYKSFSNKNYLTPIKTQGSDVGYKNVTVSEVNNGKVEYIYYSPIDYPEQISTFIKPHIPSKNIDYKRGLPKEEKIFNSNKIISSSEYFYDFVSYEELSGIKIFRYLDDKYFQGTFFNSYAAMKSLYNGNDGIWETDYGSQAPAWFIKSPILFHCGDPFTQRNFYIRPIKEAYGWAKLASKVTKNYTYDNSNNQYTTQTTENFTYNPINKQIAEHTVTNSLGETLKTKYYYHTGNSIYSQNRIAEIEKIETYRGTNLMSTNKINYSNVWTGNVSYLPQSISTSKGTNTLESRVKYNKYDQYGNPLEVQQENGTLISYIWGYNQTQPVAKLENIAYSSIPASLITNIQSVSNLPTSTEAQIFTELNALRTSTDANLQKALITTYTYKPLVGVSTITDPKGDKITYEYDNFNRLKTIYDKNGNKLSENEYHYRP